MIEETGWESGALGNWVLLHTDPDKPINVTSIGDSPIGESKALQIGYPQGHEGGGGTEPRHDIAARDRSTEIYGRLLRSGQPAVARAQLGHQQDDLPV